MTTLPPSKNLSILFAHPAYRLGDAFAARDTGIAWREVRDLAGLEAGVGEADVVVCSGLWRNHLLGKTDRLRLVQSVSAGVDQYDKALFQAAGVRLASAQGVNERAVAEHAIALTLALTRKIHEARDAQHRAFWRPMIGDPTRREDELGGKCMVVVGLGRIGSRIARLAKAFDMRVIGLKSDPSRGGEAADEVHRFDALPEIAAKADVLMLSCALTPQSQGLVDAAVLARLKPDALLVNVARGKVVDEPALIAALEGGRLAGAGLDVTVEEPLPAASPLWAMPNVLVTPHSAGETRRYEGRVVDLLLDNIGRLQRGEALANGIV